jgi:hypothetical protein
MSSTLIAITSQPRKLAIDGEIEHRHVAGPLLNLKLCPYGPDVPCQQRRLCSDQLPLIPGRARIEFSFCICCDAQCAFNSEKCARPRMRTADPCQTATTGLRGREGRAVKVLFVIDDAAKAKGQRGGHATRRNTIHTGLPVSTTSPVRSRVPLPLSILNVTIVSLSSFATNMKRWVGSMAKKRGVLP